MKFLVPRTPGGASDALARNIAQKLNEKWGQPVVVDNRPGAGGNVGREVVANSPPDGYTLLRSYVGTHAINGALYKKLPFNPEKDFAPLATLAKLRHHRQSALWPSERCRRELQPAKTGTPQPHIHTYWIGNRRLVLDAQLQAGNRHSPSYGRSGLSLDSEPARR